MDSFKFEWLTTYKRLYMAQAERLGDPLEGTTPEGHRKWWNNLMQDAETEEKRNIYRHNQTVTSRFAADFRQNYYVSCWHLNQNENLDMWHRYTATKDAVAVRTSYSALQEAMPTFVYTGMVRYINYESSPLPTLNLLENIMHKNIEFSWEKEVRVVAFPPPSPELGQDQFFEHCFESESDPTLKIYAPTINLELVHAVVLHPKSSEEFRTKVADMCANRGMPAPEASRYAQIPSV